MDSEKPRRKGPATGRIADGTQSVRRAIAVLRLLAQHQETGLRLAEAVSALGLNKATTHRLLTALVAERLASQDPQSRNYFLGFEIYSLGVAAGNRYGVVSLGAASVSRIAAESGDTAYLIIRNGDDAVCAIREVGSFPIKALTFPPGERVPLGVGSGSMVILAFLPEEERERLISATLKRLQKDPRRMTEAYLRESIAQARKTGMSTGAGNIVPGMKGIAVPVFAPNGTVAAALSMAAIETRLQGQRATDALKLLKREAGAIETRLRTGYPQAM
jgi:DNA-binding IclR family transcriptional regulator